MKSRTSLVAQQTRLSEWADLIRDCQNRPQGMKIDEWCQLHDITKAGYYWRLRKVREAYLETADQTQTFVEVPSPAIHPVNMISEHKIAAVIRGRNNLTLEITVFIQADRVIELIYLKYMKAMISYDNVTRIETYPLPKAAVREAVYNAIIHSNYAALVPIQIRIHEDAVYISNDCVFPVGWTVETLMECHRSQLYNPNIANGFSGQDMWKHGAWDRKNM